MLHETAEDWGSVLDENEFQWAPTLGGECYSELEDEAMAKELRDGFNGHPPLGVNATKKKTRAM